jgi:cytidine deaminase
MEWDALIAAATAARELAYAPYSQYKVGAALLMDDGSVFAAPNVENCLPALGTCAERNAMTAAIGTGRRKPVAVAVITESSPPAYPCGLCRQTLLEFATPDLKILVTNPQGEREERTLGEILPYGFQLKEWGPLKEGK